MNDPSTRVLLLGTHGQHNIGDELLLETFLDGLGDHIEYVINSYDVAFTTAQVEGRYRATVIDTAGDRLALWGHLGKVDAVVFAGGSIVKELYASVGRFRYATLLMLLAIVVAARLRHVPVAMLHVGVGPITTRWGRLLARVVLRGADLVTVRDAASARLCREFGVRAHESADIVFSTRPHHLLPNGGRDDVTTDGPLRIALNLNFHIANPENWEHFQESLAAALRSVADEREIEIHLLPMQSRGKVRDDATVLSAFAKRLPGIDVVPHGLQDHSDVARIIASCDVVLAERFHAIVIAALLGVPTFALSYDVKVAELAESLELAAWQVDINRPIDAVALAARTVDLIDQRAEAGEALRLAARLQSVRARRDLATAKAWLAGVGDPR